MGLSALKQTFPDGLDALQRRGRSKRGASFAVVWNTTLATLVAPATNVNGLILRTASVGAWGSNGVTTLVAAPSAPSAYSDTAKSVLALAVIGSSTTVAEIEIPAGYGLYMAAGVAAGSVAAITYDLL